MERRSWVSVFYIPAGVRCAQVPASLAFLLVGFAPGWLFELFKAQTEVTDRSRLWEMQQHPLTALLTPG
jgi:hypothetical protein